MKLFVEFFDRLMYLENEILAMYSLLTWPESLSSMLEPIAWFLLTCPVFALTLFQEPSSRWWLLPLNIYPAVQSYLKTTQLAAIPGVDWLLAFTSLVYIVHVTSALYIEQWTLPFTKRPSDQMETSFIAYWSTVKMAVRAWMNPRRLRLRPDLDRSSPSARSAHTRASFIQYFEEKQPAGMYSRLKFALKHAALCLALGALCFGIEAGILLTLLPGPRDFRSMHQSYFPWKTAAVKPLIHIPNRQLHFNWHTSIAGAVTPRVLVLRSVYALHWAWLTAVILTVAHSTLAVLFVSILQIDEPNEWPQLFGHPKEAFTVRRFWSRFWHQIATPSLLVHGRTITQRIPGIRHGSSMEKSILAAFTFGASTVIHVLVENRTNMVASESGPNDATSSNGAWRDVCFLGLNFMAGLMEHWTSIISNYLTSQYVAKKSQQRTVTCIVGYVWVFLFFWCIIPPYQYPVQYQNAISRVPFRVRFMS